MSPENCPKWMSCNAPICPLDPDWRRRRHVAGERICLWLREWAKSPSGGKWSLALGGEIAAEVQRVAPEIRAADSDIRAKLKAASLRGSKIASGHALRTRR